MSKDTNIYRIHSDNNGDEPPMSLEARVYELESNQKLLSRDLSDIKERMVTMTDIAQLETRLIGWQVKLLAPIYIGFLAAMIKSMFFS